LWGGRAVGYNGRMDNPRVLTGKIADLETMERKIEWFLSLSFEERHAHLEDMMDFVAKVNPEVARSHEHAASKSVRILRLP